MFFLGDASAGPAGTLRPQHRGWGGGNKQFAPRRDATFLRFRYLYMLGLTTRAGGPAHIKIGTPQNGEHKQKVIADLAATLGLTGAEKTKLEAMFGKQEALDSFSYPDFEAARDLAGDCFKGPPASAAEPEHEEE